jgi:hypothetical protein
MDKSIDQKIAEIIAEMNTLGRAAFEAKQRATNPNFYKSGLNELHTSNKELMKNE